MNNLLSADGLYDFCWMYIGLPIPRAYIRGLSLYKRCKLQKWLVNLWNRANDNSVPFIKKPSWVPKKYYENAPSGL